MNEPDFIPTAADRIGELPTQEWEVLFLEEPKEAWMRHALTN